MHHDKSRKLCVVGRSGWLLLAALGAGNAVCAEDKLIVAEPFAPSAGWALETDDAFVLTKAGCLEALARLNYSGELEPALATGWRQVSDTAWDFSIRSGVRFHNGEELTAEGVAAALNHVLSVDAPARAFSPKVVVSVVATDASTVRITTPSASVVLPHRLASPNTGILAPAAYAGERIDPVGTCSGPFKLVEHIPQQLLRLERNDDYWGGPVQLAAAELRFIPDGGVRATQVQTGEAHVSRNLPVASLQRLRTIGDVQVVTVETPRTNGLYFNNSKAPFSNAVLRKAVQSAVDVTAIAESIYEGSARPAVGPFAPDEPWAPRDAGVVSYDLETAKALLAEAGIEPGQLKTKLLAYSERAELPDLAAVVQAQLREIGIDVDIRVANYAAIEPELLAGNFDMFLLSRNHLADVADPIGFLTADYTCNGGYNLSKFCDQEVDRMLEQARGLADPAARHQLYASVASRLQNEAITTFLVHVQQSDAARSNVRNYRIHPYAHYLLVPQLSLAP